MIESILPLTAEQLQKALPSAAKRVPVFIEPLNLAMAEYGITSKNRVAAFLAQIGHESGSFKYVEEIASGKAYEFREDLGNLEPEAIAAARRQNTTTGRFYKGHGLIQITGYYNHKECGKALRLDLVNHPELLKEPINACRSAAWFWNSRGLNALADVGRFDDITRRINGGYNGKADRDALYERAKSVL